MKSYIYWSLIVVMSGLALMGCVTINLKYPGILSFVCCLIIYNTLTALGFLLLKILDKLYDK